MTTSADLHCLVVSPLGRDAQLITTALEQSGVETEISENVASAAGTLRSRNVGALLIAEEALGREAVALLATALAEQPSWSEPPILVLTMEGKQRPRGWQREQYLPLGKITLLERPMHVVTLVSSVKAALRVRSRQYERKLLDEALRKNDRLAVVGRLAASIAHEINNPLEAVINTLYLLSGTALNREQQEYLATAQQELKRVAEIAAQTLTFNRQSNVRGQASVPALLDSVLTLYHARLTNSNIRIERDYQNTAPITCYPGELRQAFANLIGNAFDATRKGGRIILRERAAIHPKTGQEGIRITVADTGQGMSAEVKAHLFEAFHSTKGLQGTGLGLWVSKGIIDRHSGSVRVRSSTEQGRSGTVFSIFVPREPREVLESAHSSLQNTATG